MKIYLIGLPTSGKSTYGKILAKKLEYDFIDLDDLVQVQNNKSIDDMFKVSEEYFRTLETKTLESCKNCDNVVISCGGGIIEKERNKSLMNGLIIYVKCNLDELEKRLLNSKISRPVSKKNSIKDLYIRRKDKYEAFMDVSVESGEILDTVEEMYAEVKKYEKNINN